MQSRSRTSCPQAEAMEQPPVRHPQEESQEATSGGDGHPEVAPVTDSRTCPKKGVSATVATGQLSIFSAAMSSAGVMHMVACRSWPRQQWPRPQATGAARSRRRQHGQARSRCRCCCRSASAWRCASWCPCRRGSPCRAGPCCPSSCPPLPVCGACLPNHNSHPAPRCPCLHRMVGQSIVTASHSHLIEGTWDRHMLLRAMEDGLQAAAPIAPTLRDAAYFL